MAKWIILFAVLITVLVIAPYMFRPVHEATSAVNTTGWLAINAIGLHSLPYALIFLVGYGIWRMAKK